uniref:Uncharacterized protein n=1 Tax=Strigamia maritima TaxID=126957 RepID=T1JH39_STRMM
MPENMSNPIKLFTDITYQTPNSIDSIVVQSGFQVVSREQRSCLGSNLTFVVTNDCLEEIIVIRRLIANTWQIFPLQGGIFHWIDIIFVQNPLKQECPFLTA